MKSRANNYKKVYCIIFLCGFILFSFWFFIYSASTHFVSHQENIEEQSFSTSIQTSLGELAIKKKLAKDVAHKDTKIPFTNSENIAIQKSIDSLSEILSLSESKNSSIVQRINSSAMESVYIKISPFTSDQFQGAFDLISSEIKNQENPKVKEELWLRAQKELKKYTNFPKKFKSIHVLISNHVGVSPKLLEFYSDKEDHINPDESGFIVMKFDGSLLVRDDVSFGTKGSWATERYRNLINLDKKQ